MSTIQNNISNLAQTLSSLSAQTQSAPLPPDLDSGGQVGSGASGADTLTLSASSAAAGLDPAQALIEQENRAAALADPASALAATHSATSLMNFQPGAALSAQGSPNASNVLNLIADV